MCRINVINFFMSQALKVAVIGVGHPGKWHADKYAASPDCKLLAVVDNNLKSAKQIAQKHGVQAYSDYHDILSRVDAISLAVPTSLHYKIAREILEAGIHCLIEKPITETIEDATTLIEIARRNRLVLQIGHKILSISGKGKTDNEAGFKDINHEERRYDNNDDEIAEQIRIYRNHGSSQQYHHYVIGYNSRLDELQAVILRIKLKHIDEFNQNRLRVAQTYNRLPVDTALELPAIPGDRDHVFHQYTLLTDNRDQLRDSLLSQQITCAIFYPIPLHRQKAFADTNSAPLPVTETVSHRCLSFPVFPEMTEHQVQTACEAILSACA